MEKSKIFLSADSGGSKTLWILLSDKGDKICEYKTAGLGAIKEGILPVLETVKEAGKYLEQFGEIDGVYLSLGGPNTDEVYDALKKVWKNINVKVVREAKGEAILHGASFLGCQSALLCGTGSTAVGLKGGRKCFAGGWGPIYGDGGSGGGLGSDALKAYLRSVDGFLDIGKVKTLFSHLEEGLDIKVFEERMELKKRAVEMSRRDVAALAPDIYTLMEEGDSFATKLYSNAAEEVAFMADAVCDNNENAKVLICGGFLKNKPLFFEMCKKAFAKKSRAELCYNEKFSPSTGACIAVLSENGVEITQEMFNKILNY